MPQDEYMLLRDKLYPGKSLEQMQPIVVSCANCEMTMWSTSDNAFVENNERGLVFCSGCK